MMKSKFIRTLSLIILSLVFSLSTKSLFAGYQEQQIKALESRESPPEDSVIETIVRPTVKYSADGLRDPFEGYKEPEKPAVEIKPQAGEAQDQEAAYVPPPSLSIQGMIWGGSVPQAIINNKVVKVGDVVEEAEIINIDKAGIIVFYKGRQHILSSPASNNLESITKKDQKQEEK